MNAIETLKELARLRNRGDYYALAQAMHNTDWPALLAEVERLKAIVNKLPKTEDGVPVTPGMKLYVAYDWGVVEKQASLDMETIQEMRVIYSTREAAKAAAKGGARPGASRRSCRKYCRGDRGWR